MSSCRDLFPLVLVLYYLLELKQILASRRSVLRHRVFIYDFFFHPPPRAPQYALDQTLVKMSDIEKKESLDGVDTSPAADQLEHVQTKEGEQHVFVRPSAKEEAAVIRKLDRRLLPIVFLLYSLAVLDQSNLGSAKLAGMEDDIDLSGNRYSLLGTVFYIAYIFSQ
jgi:hypothetical protein